MWVRLAEFPENSVTYYWNVITNSYYSTIGRRGDTFLNNAYTKVALRYGIIAFLLLPTDRLVKSIRPFRLKNWRGPTCGIPQKQGDILYET